jgi:hypothetical protein
MAPRGIPLVVPLLVLVAVGAQGRFVQQTDQASLSAEELALKEEQPLRRARSRLQETPAEPVTFKGCVGGKTQYQDASCSACTEQLCKVCCPASANTIWATDTCQWKTAFPDGAKIGFLHVGKTGGSSVGYVLKNLVDFGYQHSWHGPNFLNVSEMHTSAAKTGRGLDAPWDMLIISVRNPIDRTLSAFNYELGRDREHMAMTLIAELMDCFPNPGNGTTPGAADAFARALSSPELCGQMARRCVLEGIETVAGPKGEFDTSYCGHLNQNTQHYVSRIHSAQETPLNAIRRGRTRAFLVRQESMDADLEGMYNWLCLPPGGWNPKVMVPEVVPTIKYDGNSADQDRHTDTFLSQPARSSLYAALRTEFQVLEALEQLADNGVGKQNAAEIAKAERHLWGDDS